MGPVEIPEYLSNLTEVRRPSLRPSMVSYPAWQNYPVRGPPAGLSACLWA
jgi:hypothetical protein